MYAKIINGDVDISTLSYSIRDVEPGISYPEIIDNKNLPSGIVYIRDTEIPQYDRSNQKLVQNGVVLDGEEWVLNYEIVELNDLEKYNTILAKNEEIRNERDLLLVQSDWTQGKDISDSISIPWSIYRQALRDISNQNGFPWDIVWPLPPTNVKMR